MTRTKLTNNARYSMAMEALQAGTFKWMLSRLVCMTCHRSGTGIWTWMDSCLIGHPYKCPCGREFSTKGGISAHQNHRRTGNTCAATISKK